MTEIRLATPRKEARWPGLLLICVVAAFELYPVWAFRFFPSQDGPMHLHNSMVISEWSRSALLRAYYDVRLTPAGNLTAELVLAGLLRFMAPLRAEKILLTLYIVLMPLAFLYTVRGIHRNTVFAAGAGFLIADNYFLRMGFWNFCLSLPLFVFLIRYTFRLPRRWDRRRVVTLALLLCLIYACHMMTWAIACTLVLLSAWTDCRRSRCTTPLACAAIALLSTLPLFVIYAVHAAAAAGGLFPIRAGSVSVAAYIRQMCGGRVLDGYTSLEALLATLTTACLIASGWFLLIRGKLQATPGARIAALLCTVVPVAALAVIGKRALVPDRASLFLCCAALLWIAQGAESPRFQRLLAVTVSALSVAFVGLRIPAYTQINARLQEYASLVDYIPANSTLLSFCLEQPAGVNPYLHASGLITSQKILVDLNNYEAGADHFLTAYRPERSPFRFIGADLESVPPMAEWTRYRTRTGGRVDFVLIFGGGDASTQQFASRLEQYDLVTISQPTGAARLYRLRSE